MLIQVCKGKIHRVRVTEANLNYVGSVTIDRNLMDAAGIVPFERVQIVNIMNGERLETYAIEGEPESGVICLNGAAARKVAVGDVVIIMAYGWLDQKEAEGFEPKVVFPDENNQVA